ncbi:RICIN domain-containing protein [Kitasatospora sp. NPDC057500]|uniref:RICIN domain-containing protein n=1 Tax=Kitasatospora sp. NPDC057500 TaxID=3346151 RepID=UPI0036C35854
MFRSKRIPTVAAITLALAGATIPDGQANEFQKVRFRNAASGWWIYSFYPQGPVKVTSGFNQPSENWDLVPATGGAYLIRNEKHQNCMQAPLEAEEPATLAPCNPYVPTQEWRLISAGDKFVINEAADHNYVLEGGVGETCSSPTENCMVKRVRTDHPRQLWEIVPL